MYLKKTIIFVCLFVFFVFFCWYQNNHLVSTFFKLSFYQSKPTIRIVHLSDLQCKLFGNQQQPLLDRIKVLHPDIIVLTGDLVDAFHYDEKSWQLLGNSLPKIAPTYFVSGNHEWWRGNFEEIDQALTKFGVVVLKNRTIEIPIKNRVICLTGINDPESWGRDLGAYFKMVEVLGCALPKGKVAVLLAHRPEHFKVYDKTKFDLVLAGHAHGGQWRLPFVGGILSPNQGYFPKYTQGLYRGKQIKMIVSRGLGNSVFPLRLFNYPELVVVDI